MSRYATRAAIRRAVDAASAAGLDITGLDLLTDGTIRIHSGQPQPASTLDSWFAGFDQHGPDRAARR